jgi:LysR family glycine cleavage system transcriptional activator
MLTDAFDRMEQASSRLKMPQRHSTLVVSTSPSFAARWLLPRLERFNTIAPKVEVRLTASTRLVDFTTDDVDLAIRFGPGHYPGLHSERLKVEEVVPVAAPRLAQQLKKPSDLLGVTLLRNDGMLWDPNFHDWKTWLKSEGVDPTHATIRAYGDEATLVIEAALAGLGVALIWRTLIADELAQGRLCAVFPGTQLTNAYHFVCPHRSLEKAHIDVFRNWIKSEMETKGD